MKEFYQTMRNEFEELYKSYRMNHFSMLFMHDKYYQVKRENEINQFEIYDQILEERVTYSEKDLDDCKEHGKYQIILAGTTITSIYQLWEDRFRSEIAKQTKLEKNAIKSDFFGDLRIVRQAIVHNNSQPISDLKNLKTLEFLGDENKLNLSSAAMNQVYLCLSKEIDRLEYVFSA